MLESLEKLSREFESDLSQVRDLASCRHLKDQWLGRERGRLSLEMRKLGRMDPAQRPAFGQRINKLKAELVNRLEKLSSELQEIAEQERLEREKLDLTLPGFQITQGYRHPLIRVQEDVESVFVRMGFSVMETPEVETDFNNFEGLNIPKDHPSRDAQDTFYIDEELLLRTHCTGVQMHAMLAGPPPLRVIALGKVYRRDNPDATHSPVFYQCDGFAVDEGITMGDLKGTLETGLRQLFSPEVQVRFRPSYFPFVEPGAEVDISCIFCDCRGCSICKGSGWIEILGAGMIHPKVFQHVGYDWKKYSGFAWGMGLDRLAILRYGINDIRLFYENDLRFLSQF